VVAGEAVRAVDRDRGRDPGLVEGERVENGLRKHDLGREPRGLEVEDTAERPGEVAVTRRPDPAAVEVGPLAADGIGDRHHDTAVQELAALGRDDPEAEELFADLSLLGDHLEERAVGVADLERAQEVHVGEPALPQVLLGVVSLAEGAVVVLDDPRQDARHRHAMRRRASSGLSSGGGVSASSGVFRTIRGPGSMSLPRSRPARRARPSRAAAKLTLSYLVTKPMTSPAAPQPKQWKSPLDGVTVKDGVFS